MEVKTSSGTGFSTPLLNGGNESVLEITAAVKDFRPSVRGKFLFVCNEKFYVRGVTYGTFRPDETGNEFRDEETVEHDFIQIAACAAHLVNGARDLLQRLQLGLGDCKACRQRELESLSLLRERPLERRRLTLESSVKVPLPEGPKAADRYCRRCKGVQQL